jgi:hypothetical protein
MADVGDEIINRIRDVVATPQLMEPDEPSSDALMMDLEMLLAIHRAGIASVYPASSDVAAWRDAYLAVWDEYTGALSEDEFVLGRRGVIVRTFADLLEVCRQYHGS